MADFAGEAGFAAEQLPVQDHAHAQSPAHVQEEDRPGVAGDTAHVLAEGHAPGVVLDEDRPAEPILQEVPDGLFFADVITVAVTGPVIDAAGEVHAQGADLLRVQAILPQLFLHAGAQAQDRFFRAGQGVGDPVLELDHPAGEIRDGQRNLLLAYLDAHEEAGAGIEPVQARTAPGGRFLFSPVGKDSCLFHFADNAGHLGDAGPQFTGEVRQAEGVPLFAEGQDVFLLRRVAAFQKTVQKSFHGRWQSRQR